MNKRVEALKRLYVKLGGQESAVAEVKTIADMIKAIDILKGGKEKEDTNE